MSTIDTVKVDAADFDAEFSESDLDGLELDPEEDAETLALARFEAAAMVPGSPEWETVQTQMRRDLAAADKEAAQFRRDFRESLEVNGTDIVEYCHATGTALHDADTLAKRVGCHTANWSDSRNSQRREKRRERAAKVGKIAQRVQAMAANKADTKPAEKPRYRLVNGAPVPVAKAAPAAPQAANSGEIQNTARAYYADAEKRAPHNAAKLQKSLAYQLSRYEADVAHFVSKGKTDSEAAHLWLRRAQLAADAKI